MSSLFLHPDWEPGFAAFWDLRDIRELHIDILGLKSVVSAAEEMAAHTGTGRAAFVVRRELDETIAQTMLLMAKNTDRERRIFYNAEEAMRWLREK